jgi:F0F1-type ATP synthase assembly protein I
MNSNNKYEQWDNLIKDYSQKQKKIVLKEEVNDKEKKPMSNKTNINSKKPVQVNRKSIGTGLLFAALVMFIFGIIVDPNEMNIPWTLIVVPLLILGLAFIFGINFLVSVLLERDESYTKHNQERENSLRLEYQNYLLKQKTDYDAYYVNGNRNMKQPETHPMDYDMWKMAKNKDLK